MPATVRCNGETFEHVETFKHDFFAATGLYRGPRGPAVLKLGRQTDLLSVPMAWLGAFLARREERLYRLLHDVPGIPECIGLTCGTGFLHAFVPGRPLGRADRVSDAFFDQLAALLAAVHARGIAYVDLNKRQNILLGDDGRPWLIDFQISLHVPRSGWGRVPGMRRLLARFQREDWYHFLKHKRRLRADLMTPEELERVERVSFWIRLHRGLTRPLTYLRRATLRRLKRSETAEVAGASAK